MQPILEKLGNSKAYGKELRFEYCPICKDKKSNPCFSVNTTTGVYFCHATNESGHLNHLEGFEGIDVNSIKTGRESDKVAPAIDFYEVFLKCNKLSGDWVEYLNKRGITEETANKVVRLGKYNQMAIPISNGETIVGIKYRNLQKNFSCERGTATNLFINYNSIKTRDYLIIVEGEIDLLSLLECGFENVVSLPFGAGNTRVISKQIKWIKEFKKVVVATDNDDVGVQCAELIQELLKKNKIRSSLVDYGDCKDFNEVLIGQGKDKVKEIVRGSLVEGGNEIEDNTSVSEKFAEDKDFYLMNTKDGFKKLTDFKIKITKYSNNHFEGISISEGRERAFCCLKTELLDKGGILKNLGYYLGDSRTIIEFLYWLESNNQKAFVKEIPHFGIIGSEYFDKNSRAICDKKDLYFKDFNEIDDLTPKENKWLNENLLGLRQDSNQSLLGICWALGRYHQDGAYPVLDVSGTTSIGKTEFVEFVSKIMLGTQENIKNFTTMTNHQIRSIASCSNITPFCIDEIKITGKRTADKLEDIYSILRAVYDNKTINQGNLEKKLNEFKLCTPLIISGETQLSDVSIKNRLISVKLTKENKCSAGTFEIFKKSDILHKLGKKALINRLKTKIEIAPEDTRDTLKQVKDDRQLYNANCLLIGLKALEDLITIDKNTKDNFIKYLNDEFSKEYTPEKNFEELLNLVVESGLFHNDFYIRDHRGHYGIFSLLYKAISTEHRKTNSTLELLDMDTIKKQLREIGFIVDYKTKRFDEENLETSSKPKRAYIFREI